ncbi:MAG: MOSC domain-containing protein [Marinicellaceae bacterium]
MIKISELYIYPVKSLAGISLNSSKLSPTGLSNDRRWLIVDENGQFMSQREFAKMATIKTAFKDDKLVLSHLESSITVPKSQPKNKVKVTVWKDTLQASHICPNVDQWLSSILKKPCQLVYMENNDHRQIDPDYAQDKQHVSFADAFPLLVISQASLDDLNSRLESKINMNRFRPNMVVTGTSAFAEDNWQDLTINKVKMKAVKMCSRCIMPSINQETGRQDQVKMLATLNQYRKIDKKIKFGQNLMYKDANLIDQQVISCGDQINLKNT